MKPTNCLRSDVAGFVFTAKGHAHARLGEVRQLLEQQGTPEARDTWSALHGLWVEVAPTNSSPDYSSHLGALDEQATALSKMAEEDTAWLPSLYAMLEAQSVLSAASHMVATLDNLAEAQGIAPNVSPVTRPAANSPEEVRDLEQARAFCLEEIKQAGWLLKAQRLKDDEAVPAVVNTLRSAFRCLQPKEGRPDDPKALAILSTAAQALAEVIAPTREPEAAETWRLATINIDQARNALGTALSVSQAAGANASEVV